MNVRSTVSTHDSVRDQLLEWIAWSFEALRAASCIYLLYTARTCYHVQCAVFDKHLASMDCGLCFSTGRGIGTWPAADPYGRVFVPRLQVVVG